MSSRRRFLVRHPVVVADIGCSCRRPKLSSLFSVFSVFSSRRNRTHRKDPDPYSPSSVTTSLWGTPAGTTTTATTNSSYESPPPSPPVRRPRTGRKKKKAGESVEVVKESSEPYLDFKESMLQMIVENEMYGWDELNELLHRLLTLNDADTHPLILRAFADIWSGILAPSNY